MKKLLIELRGAMMATIVLAIVCCGVYPLIVFAFAQVLFPAKANGSLIVDSSGAVRGSQLIGQQFTAGKYFHSRPSDAGSGYDATSSGGSNLGPTSKKLADTIAQNIADYRAENSLGTNDAVPADAVTASGSGLDPHISPRNAELQAARVARARGLPIEKVLALVRQHTDGPGLGIFGEPGVNVLDLNLALDNLSHKNSAMASPPGRNEWIPMIHRQKLRERLLKIAVNFLTVSPVEWSNLPP